MMLSKITPSFVNKRVRQWGIKLKIARVQKKQLAALMTLKDKKVINCVFFALFEDVWKYDGLYRLMEKHTRFNPIILVCPIVNYGRENMLDRMERCFSSFKKKGYNVIRSYDETTDTYINVRKTLNPDIIFYTNPYKGLIDDRYFVTSFDDKLTAYVPYFMDSDNDYHMACNLLFHNIVWRIYSETEYHRQLSIKYAINKGVNVVNTGYPGIEPYLSQRQTKRAVKRKCIIWAPHHTIEPMGIIYYSCFLQYCDVMIEFAKKYSDSVCFVFKPHPLLKNKLYKKWGKEKTDSYYHLWEEMENTSLNEGAYENLFIESDAMIHDSASFIVEYLYLNKPVMRTLNGEDLKVLYNTFGLQCIDNHYIAQNKEDIEQFIKNVIDGKDPMKEQRTKFVNEMLIPQGSPSQNIIDDLLYSIDNQVLFRN